MSPPGARRAAVDEPDLSARCARDLLEVVPAVMDALRGAMRRHVGGPLSVPQFRGLHFVGRHPGCTVGEVAAFLGVTMPTASALVDRLARSGLLDTGTDPADRRRARLSLSPAGRAQLVSIGRGAHVELVASLGACSPDDLRDLKRGLEAMQRLFAGPAATPPLAAVPPAPAVAVHPTRPKAPRRARRP
jgi:DNA-binding MarR family transcriptional regulator